MNAADAVYKTTEIAGKVLTGIGHGFQAAFNKVSGITNLHKNGLEFGGGEILFTAMAAPVALMTTLYSYGAALGMNTQLTGSQTLAYLSTSFAAAVAAPVLTGRLSCLHLKGQQRAEQRKQRRAARMSA